MTYTTMNNLKESYFSNTSLKDMKNELWIDVFGFDGLYQISSLGRVKSIPRERFTPSGGIYYTKERILRQTKNKTSGKSINMYVTLCKDGVQYTNTVLQYSGMSFIRPTNGKECFYHKNKDTSDNRIENIGITSISKSRSIDHGFKKRTVHNYIYFEKHTRPKYKIIRCDGKEYTYSQIKIEYGRAAYFNIMRGQKVRGYNWAVTPL